VQLLRGPIRFLCVSPFSINDLRNLIVVAIAHRMWTDARHREVVAHGGTAQSATTICFRCLLHQVPSAAATGARGSLAPRLLAGPVHLAMDFTDEGPHHIETSTSDSRASAPVASTPQDCGAERRIVAPITRTRFQGIPP
jgi:hypothetical protein